MAPYALWRLTLLTACLISTIPVAYAASEVAGTDVQLLSGE